MLPGMTAKPSYLGLLNAISNAEAEAECYLSAWASVTPREDVRTVLRTVALREGEHAKADERMAVACSTSLSDLEKFERLELGLAPVDGKPDIFAGMFGDPTIDIQTGGLLGRYIAEERDSGRLFQSCRAQLTAEARSNGAGAGAIGANGSNGAAAASTAPAGDALARIEQLLQRLADKLSV